MEYSWTVHVNFKIWWRLWGKVVHKNCPVEVGSSLHVQNVHKLLRACIIASRLHVISRKILRLRNCLYAYYDVLILQNSMSHRIIVVESFLLQVFLCYRMVLYFGVNCIVHHVPSLKALAFRFHHTCLLKTRWNVGILNFSWMSTLLNQHLMLCVHCHALFFL